MDLLPIDVLRRILSALTNISEEEDEPSIRSTTLSRFRLTGSKEAYRTCILSKSFLEASSTLPDLNIFDDIHTDDANHRVRLANYLNHTLTRYQHHNIPIRTLRLAIDLNRDKNFANFLIHFLRNCDEYAVDEIHLFLVYCHHDLLQSIFSFKKLVSLRLHGCKFSDHEYLINCSSLRTLEFCYVTIFDWVLDELFCSCPLIEALQLIMCPRLLKINVANLPNLKSFEVNTINNQIVDVNAPSLERMTYSQSDDKLFSYRLSIHSTQNLQGLKLQESIINDEQFSNLIASCPVLKELILDKCPRLNHITVSSHALTFLSLNSCRGLREVIIDAPILTEFEYVATNVLPSLAFTSGDFWKINSSVTLSLDYITPKLRQFLKAFKSSDNISLIITCEKIFSNNNIINRDDNDIIPEFEMVQVVATSRFLRTYSSLMEQLLASFSPKILVVKKDKHENFVKYLCKELLLFEDVEDDKTNSSTRLSQSWRNYFRQAKLEGIDEKWQPLHSWKSMEDVSETLADQYIVKLYHT